MMRLELMTAKPSKKLPGAMTMRIKVNKTKVYQPNDEVIEVDFVYGKGFYKEFDLMEYAKHLGILKLGNACRVNWPGEAEPESICKGGAAGLKDWLMVEDNFNKLKTACETVASMPVEEQVEMVEDDE